MDISFIIPARNEGEALQETVFHLCATSRRYAFEVIVIDDNSDRPLLQNCDRPRELKYYRSRTRLGVARARNLGAAMARGRILIFIDAHVCFSNGWLNHIVCSGVHNNRQIVGTATRVLYNFSEFQAFARGFRDDVFDLTKLYFGWFIRLAPRPQACVNRSRRSERPFAVPYVGAATLAIGRELFYDLGQFEGELDGYGNMEDAELAMRCWSFGHAVYVIPSVVCLHYTDKTKQALKHASRSRHILDHPQYDRAIENAIRVVYLHFPDSVAKEMLVRFFHSPSAGVTVEAVVTDRLESRKMRIDRCRKFDREWLLSRITEI